MSEKDFYGLEALPDAYAHALYNSPDLVAVSGLGIAESARRELVVAAFGNVNVMHARITEVWYNTVPTQEEADRIVQDWASETWLDPEVDLEVSGTIEAPAMVRHGGTPPHFDEAEVDPIGFAFGPLAFSYGLRGSAALYGVRMEHTFTPEEVSRGHQIDRLVATELAVLDLLDDGFESAFPVEVIQGEDDLTLIPGVPRPTLHVVSAPASRQTFTGSFVVHRKADENYEELRQNWAKKRLRP